MPNADDTKLRDIVFATPSGGEGLFLICESYYAAIEARPSQIEALDMGRRGAARARAAARAAYRQNRVDLDTARRLFTLICAFTSRCEARRRTDFRPACSLPAARIPSSPVWRGLAKRHDQASYIGRWVCGQAHVDTFVASALDEIGIDVHRHHAKTFEDVDPSC